MHIEELRNLWSSPKSYFGHEIKEGGAGGGASCCDVWTSFRKSGENVWWVQKIYCQLFAFSVCSCSDGNLATYSTVLLAFIFWSVLGTVAVCDTIYHFCWFLFHEVYLYIKSPTLQWRYQLLLISVYIFAAQNTRSCTNHTYLSHPDTPNLPIHSPLTSMVK